MLKFDTSLAAQELKQARRQPVIRAFNIALMPDETISVEVTVVDVLEVDGEPPRDSNWRQVRATYKDAAELASLAVQIWAPSPQVLAQLEAQMAAPETATQAIFQGFLAILKGAAIRLDGEA
jgi:hypothetical protein